MALLNFQQPLVAHEPADHSECVRSVSRDHALPCVLCSVAAYLHHEFLGLSIEGACGVVHRSRRRVLSGAANGYAVDEIGEALMAESAR